MPIKSDKPMTRKSTNELKKNTKKYTIDHDLLRSMHEFLDGDTFIDTVPTLKRFSMAKTRKGFSSVVLYRFIRTKRALKIGGAVTTKRKVFLSASDKADCAIYAGGSYTWQAFFLEPKELESYRFYLCALRVPSSNIHFTVQEIADIVKHKHENYSSKEALSRLKMERDYIIDIRSPMKVLREIPSEFIIQKKFRKLVAGG